MIVNHVGDPSVTNWSIQKARNPNFCSAKRNASRYLIEAHPVVSPVNLQNASHCLTRRHIYIYICCEVIIWAKFSHFRCYYLGQAGVIIWAKLFLAYKNSGFKRFLAHTVVILCFFFCAQLSGNYPKIAFFKKRVQKLGFSIFCVLSLKFEISPFLGLLKHYKNRGFS